MDSITMFEKWAEAMADDCRIARTSITISALSMQPPRKDMLTPWGLLWSSWIDAAKRGVSVTVFLAAPTKIHPATAGNAGAAVRAFEQGINTRFVPQPNLLHAKSCVIDNSIVWIGSGNMTAAAAHFNHEVYVRFAHAGIASRLTCRWDSIANIQ